MPPPDISVYHAACRTIDEDEFAAAARAVARCLPKIGPHDPRVATDLRLASATLAAVRGRADPRSTPARADADAMRHWATTVILLCRRLAAAPELPPVLAEQLERLAAAALLSLLPADGTGSVPAAVRRAVAYIDGHADKPVSGTDIAASAGIGTRALQEAFRRHLDTTPTTYLRRVRLERAHRDLCAALPTSGATVRAIARRWRFANVGRFAAAYRAAYGQPPSHTLREWPRRRRYG